jgi:hypothetical protein
LLLGLVFFVFGLNAFLQFFRGPIPGLAGQFLQALFQSQYLLAIGAVQAERLRVCPQSEAVLRRPQALRRALVCSTRLVPFPILPNECFDFAS